MGAVVNAGADGADDTLFLLGIVENCSAGCEITRLNLFRNKGFRREKQRDTVSPRVDSDAYIRKLKMKYNRPQRDAAEEDGNRVQGSRSDRDVIDLANLKIEFDIWIKRPARSVGVTKCDSSNFR